MIKKEIFLKARQQVGLYIAAVMKQRGINKMQLAERAGIERHQLYSILKGNTAYTIDTFLVVIQALDCYFFLADKEGEHLNFEHMEEKSDPDKAMDFGKE